MGWHLQMPDRAPDKTKFATGSSGGAPEDWMIEFASHPSSQLSYVDKSWLQPSKGVVSLADMAESLLVLLCAFGLVLGVGITFVYVYRQQLSHLRRSDRRLLPNASFALRRVVDTSSPPNRWLAVRSTNTGMLQDWFRIHRDLDVSWSEALMRVRERRVFLSPTVEGWTMVIGAALPDPADDPDKLFHFLTALSAEFGEVQYYSAERVLNFHGWARLRNGRVLRAYAWTGETVWNEGRITLDERLLGLRTFAYGEAPELDRIDGKEFAVINCQRVQLLARRWSFDPVAASELILQQEHFSTDPDRLGQG